MDIVYGNPLPSSDRSSSYGFKPKQNIPEAAKDETWAAENVDWCISMSPMWFKQKTDEYYALFNGKRTIDQFDHITKTYGIEFPAGKLKHIPLIRPLLNRILSEIEERMFEFVVHGEDTDSIERKIEKIQTHVLKDVIEIVKKNEDPNKALSKLEHYYRNEFKMEDEIGLQHYLNQYSQKHRLDRSFSEAALDKIITGLQYYRVKVNRLGEDPEYKVIKPGTLFHADNDKKWVNECDWAVHPVLMTPTEIIDAFGERMKPEDVKTVESWLDMYHKDAFYKLNSAQGADKLLMATDTSNIYNVNATENHKIMVYFVEWKSIRKINLLQNPNKYDPASPFTKLLNEESLRELPASRKKNVKYRYIQDLWEGVRIGDNMFVDLGRAKYPVRSMSVPSRVSLTFNGLTFNGKIKPYSLIGETNDVQDLYDVLHYHKENLIALSGSRGSYMDLSQIPDFKTGSFAGNLKMFLYYKKMGTAFVDRGKEGADNSFNQFPTFDETLGSLEGIMSTIQHLEDVAGRIVGINRQQLGQTQNYDGKSVTQSAIQNSSMLTEWLHNEHDEFVERSLTDIANASRVAHRGGVVGHYTDRRRTQHLYRLDDVVFPYSDYGIHITNKSADKRSVAELKAMSMQLMREGLMQIEDILPMFKQQGLAEVMREVEMSVTRRRVEMEEQTAQMQQLQVAMAKAKEEAEIKKLQAQAGELFSKIEKNRREMELEQQLLQQKSTTDNKKLDLDRERVDLERTQLEVYAKQNAVKSAEVKNN